MRYDIRSSYDIYVPHMNQGAGERERAGAGAVIATILWSSPCLLLYYSEKSAKNSRVDFH